MISSSSFILMSWFLLNIFTPSASQNAHLQNFDFEENQPCTSSLTNGSGFCTHFKNCDTQSRLSDLNICSFVFKVPIICCPVGDKIKSPRISELKCEEYRQKYPQHLVQTMVPMTVGIPVESLTECPHMAQIGYRNQSHATFYCGGSLISESFVITAAHCRINNDLKNSNVVRLDYDDDHDIKTFIRHPQYNANTKHNDIALVEMKTSFQFSANSIPACLSHRTDTDGMMVDIFGYGQTSFIPTGVLKIYQYKDAPEGEPQKTTGFFRVTLEVVKNDYCANEYEEDDIEIVSTQLCAHDKEKRGRDTCLGDSGGPLQTEHFTSDRKIYFELIAITSFGIYCGTSTPGVYTRIQPYLDWIENFVWP